MAVLQKRVFRQDKRDAWKVLKYKSRARQLQKKPVSVRGGCDCGYTQLLNVSGQANHMLLVSGRSQNLT